MHADNTYLCNFFNMKIENRCSPIAFTGINLSNIIKTHIKNAPDHKSGYHRPVHTHVNWAKALKNIRV